MSSMRRAVSTKEQSAATSPVVMRMRLTSSLSPEDRSLGDNDQDAAALQPRPRRAPPLTSEEKALRRRLQYKLHQRRHRARQKDTILALEQHVTALAETVARLEHEWQQLKASTVFASRGTVTGTPAKIAMEYLRLFKHGLIENQVDMQSQFLHAAMRSDVSGPDYQGIDTLLVQWRYYGAFFLKSTYIPGPIHVSTVGDMTIVTVDVVLGIHSRREGIECLYPNLIGMEHVIQGMISRPIEVPGKLRFIFDDTGRISWFGTDMDFASGLQGALGSLQLVAACMQNAQISFCTGQIKPGSRQQKAVVYV